MAAMNISWNIYFKNIALTFKVWWSQLLSLLGLQSSAYIPVALEIIIPWCIYF